MAKPMSEMETLFKALADDTRLRILGLLLTGEVCVCDIHESLKIPQSKASRHLAYLRRSRLVDTRRSGLWIHYRIGRLADPVLAAIVDAVRHALAHIDTVQKDAARLRKRNGCCLPAPTTLMGATCCSVGLTVGAAGRRRVSLGLNPKAT
jgi:ArsR family transcriptional regulator